MNTNYRSLATARNLDWLGLAIEAPTKKNIVNIDDNQSYPRSCNFSRNLAATGYNSTGSFTHLLHSNKQETHIYLLNTIIDMIINLSEKLKVEFLTLKNLNDNLKSMKDLVKAVEHIITQDNQTVLLNNKIQALQQNTNNLTQRLDEITNLLARLPSGKEVKEAISTPKKIEEQTLKLISQIGIDADGRLNLIKTLIEKFHNEWLG